MSEFLIGNRPKALNETTNFSPQFVQSFLLAVESPELNITDHCLLFMTSRTMMSDVPQIQFCKG